VVLGGGWGLDKIGARFLGCAGLSLALLRFQGTNRDAGLKTEAIGIAQEFLNAHLRDSAFQ
jgi:hypothetical protein